MQDNKQNMFQIIEQYKADSQSVYNTWFVENDLMQKIAKSITTTIQQ